MGLVSLHCQWCSSFLGVNPELEDYIDLPHGRNEENVEETQINVENDEVKYSPISVGL